MKITKEEQIKKLEEMIEKGKWNYVIIYGVIIFGGFMFIIMTLYYKYIMGYEINNFLINLNITVYAILGFIYGLWGWRSINKKLKRLKK